MVHKFYVICIFLSLVSFVSGGFRTVMGPSYYDGVANSFVLDDAKPFLGALDENEGGIALAGRFGTTGFIYYLDSSRNEIVWDINFSKMKSIYQVSYSHGNVYAIGTDKTGEQEVLVVIRGAADLRIDPYEASGDDLGYIVSKTVKAKAALANGLHISSTDSNQLFVVGSNFTQSINLRYKQEVSKTTFFSEIGTILDSKLLSDDRLALFVQAFSEEGTELALYLLTYGDTQAPTYEKVPLDIEADLTLVVTRAHISVLEENDVTYFSFGISTFNSDDYDPEIEDSALY